MNKFRVNLHPAFFNGMTEKQTFYPSSENLQEDQENKELIDEVENKTEEVREAVQEQEFPNVAGEVASRASSRYSDMEQLKKDRTRFQERHNNDYGKAWQKRITESYGTLKTALKEKGYFEGKDEQEEMAKIKELYKKEVYSQYEKYIWRAKDSKFDDIKDNIFGANSKDWPANKIYCELTGAVTILNKRKNSKITTYDVEIKNKKEENTEGTDDTIESATTKTRIQFLAHDLPNYLWQVKDKTTLQKIGGWLPLISVKVDRPSLEDKKGIENFIKAVDKLTLTEEGKGENLELALLKIFNELDSNATEKQIEEALNASNISLKNPKYIKSIKKAFEFYKNVSGDIDASVRNQHALYLSILDIVKKHGGFDKAISAFEKDVEEYKNNLGKEGKDYKKGEVMKEEYPEFKAFVDSLGVKDYTSATRLAEKPDEYFNKTSIVDILADLNNDGTLNFADSGLTKTGLQFKEIYNYLGEDVALNNLLDAAKLKNKGLLDTPLKDEDFTKEKIQEGNKNLILLLQNIISNPGVDLNVLMAYGADSSERFADSAKLIEEADAQKDKAADELLKDIDLTNLKLEGVEVASAEGLHQAVAGALYTEYARGVGLGSRIKFNDWVKGLSLNGGIQVTDKGVDIGLSLAYNREISLGKGWTVAPGASIGFIPMFKFGESVGVEVAKKWIDDNAVQQKIGLRTSFTNIAGGVQVYSAFLGYERDSLAGIEGSRKEIESLFKGEIVSPLLNTIATEFKDKEFDLSIEENVDIVRKLIEGQILKLYEGDKNKLNNSNKVQDIKAMLDNTIRYLQNYNKAPIQNEQIRELIANEMSNSYSFAWAELNKEKHDGKTEFSDARIGASWVQAGTFGALVLHAGVGVTKYEKDMYGDAYIRRQKIKVNEKFRDSQTWNKEMLDDFNQYMPENSKFELVEIGDEENKEIYIKIPVQAIQNVNILLNPGMKGLIKKDEEGNVLLSTETVMNMPSIFRGAARKATDVLIGGGNESRAIRLDSILNDDSWFAEGEIDKSKLTGKETVEFTVDGLNSALKDLKQKLPDNETLQNFNFDESILSELEQGKKYRIVLKNTAEGIKVTVQEVQEGANLKIEYEGHQNLDIMGETSRAIANKVYAESLKVTSNRLYAISHDIRNNQGTIIQRKWKTYTDFANAVSNQDYLEAKRILVGMLPEMDRYVGEGVKFSSITEDLNNIDDKELGQALLSVNNIFARVTSVHGGKDGEYHFKKYRNGELVDRSIGDVISGRAKEISRKVTASGLDESTKQAYQNLINFAENHRENNADRYSDISKKGKIYEGAIGINLGNSISLENPLFNPEVYESPVIDSNELDFEGKDELQEHIMKDVIANNKSLLQPILSALGLEGDSISVVEDSYDKETGKITLDIDGKNVILGADMKFGYFAQCVNHMLLIDNITAEIPGEGSSVSFNTSVIRDGELKEGTLGSLYSKTRVGVDVAFTVHKQENTEEKQDTTTEPEETIREKKDTTTEPEETERNNGDDNTGDNNTGDDNTGGDIPPLAGEGQTGGGGGGGRDED